LQFLSIKHKSFFLISHSLLFYIFIFHPQQNPHPLMIRALSHSPLVWLHRMNKTLRELKKKYKLIRSIFMQNNKNMKRALKTAFNCKNSISLIGLMKRSYELQSLSITFIWIFSFIFCSEKKKLFSKTNFVWEIHKQH